MSQLHTKYELIQTYKNTLLINHTDPWNLVSVLNFIKSQLKHFGGSILARTNTLQMSICLFMQQSALNIYSILVVFQCVLLKLQRSCTFCIMFRRD